MRVSSRDLRAARREGILTRFAVLGPVVFVLAELPHGGSSDTSLEQPCQQEHWGFVLRGSLTLHGREERVIGAGSAFYVAPGGPDHWFTADGGTTVAGFAPLDPTVDTRNPNLKRLGFEIVARPPVVPRPPSSITAAEPGTTYRTMGTIDLAATLMGSLVFARTTYGPLSGYTSTICDLPHWGMVLSGDLVLKGETSIELLTAGDVYYCPAGPPGHQFQVADSATTIDYTPLADLRGPGRKAEWRRQAFDAIAADAGVLEEVGGPAVGLEAAGRGQARARRRSESGNQAIRST